MKSFKTELALNNKEHQLRTNFKSGIILTLGKKEPNAINMKKTICKNTQMWF